MKSNRKRHGRKNKHVVRKINEIRKKKKKRQKQMENVVYNLGLFWSF